MLESSFEIGKIIFVMYKIISKYNFNHQNYLFFLTKTTKINLILNFTFLNAIFKSSKLNLNI